jgi:hypothetical protein
MNDELCALCGGRLEARVVRVVHERGPDDAPVIVEGVRADVCTRGGHRWFSLEVMRELKAFTVERRRLRRRRK